ncbi:hypothetical protein COS83_03475, partial [archaeon CG07_land_8_20_14_0_80_38_8]
VEPKLDNDLAASLPMALPTVFLQENKAWNKEVSGQIYGEFDPDPVELLAARNRASKTYYLGNGQYSWISMAVPIHYESQPDSGFFNAEIDLTPQSVN